MVWGLYATPKTDTEEELVKASQLSASDWFGNPDPWKRAAPADDGMAAVVSNVTRTWGLVYDSGLEKHGVEFFRRIFTIAPQALALFSFKDEPDLYASPKLKKHAVTVMTTVGVAVAGLKDVAALVPVLKGLGAKHKTYGVLPAHYDVVGQALIETLAAGLGEHFTDEVKGAWAAVYGIVSKTMIEGAEYDKPEEPEAPAPADDGMAAVVSNVTRTWGLVYDSGLEKHGVEFFRRIFTIAPQALALFSFKDEPDLYASPKLKKHAVTVMTTVGVAVAGLKDVAALVPVLKGLGAKHKTYGVLPAHYDVVGQTLIETLAAGLGEHFTDEVKGAWAAVYGIVSKTMIEGAEY